MTDHLIVESLHLRKLHAVRFAETAQLHIYERHNVSRRKLWYTESEYYSMKRAVSEDVLKVRAARTSNEAPANEDDDNASAEESSR
jgi:hypothetical protein